MKIYRNKGWSPKNGQLKYRICIDSFSIPIEGDGVISNRAITAQWIWFDEAKLIAEKGWREIS
jgi:hypothetical protein